MWSPLSHKHNQRQSMLWVIYMMSVFFTLHYVLPLYVNSTYLNTFTTESLVGVIYTIAATITLIGMIAASRAVEKYGNYKTTLVLFWLETATLTALALFDSLLFVMIAFLGHFILTAVLKFNIDIFLESFSQDEETGTIRGAYLTSINLAFILAPTISGLLLTNADYWKVYLGAIVFLIPMGILLMRRMKKFEDGDYSHVTLFEGVRHLKENKDVLNIFFANLMLKFFYAWMIVYTPIYLHEHIGFAFSAIGPLFSIMLSAFVLVQIPLGKLADDKYGEKEMLSLGFVIAAVTTTLLSFISTPHFVIWAGILFATRIGAAMIEVMSESYFFKQIDANNTDYLTFFRMTRPLGYIGSSILASGFLFFFPIKYLFVGIGIFMLFGLRFSSPLHDTK